MNYSVKDAHKIFLKKHGPNTTYGNFKNGLLDYILLQKKTKQIHTIHWNILFMLQWWVKLGKLNLIEKEIYFAVFHPIHLNIRVEIRQNDILTKIKLSPFSNPLLKPKSCSSWFSLKYFQKTSIPVHYCVRLV